MPLDRPSASQVLDGTLRRSPRGQKKLGPKQEDKKRVAKKPKASDVSDDEASEEESDFAGGEIPEALFLNLPPRKILALCGVTQELDLNISHPPSFFALLKAQVTLAIQDYCIRKFQNWRDWTVLKIDKARRMHVSGFVYFLTFQAHNGGGLVHTFEGHVWETTSFRRVDRVRIISPITTKWRPGHLWIPLT